MPTVKMVEYADAAPEVRAVYDDIMKTRSIDRVPNFWRTLASHPPLLRDVWECLKAAMRPGKLDALTKELIALAVSATNGCEYCINSHTAAARKLGADEEVLGELMAVGQDQTLRFGHSVRKLVAAQPARGSDGGQEVQGWYPPGRLDFRSRRSGKWSLWSLR